MAGEDDVISYCCEECSTSYFLGEKNCTRGDCDGKVITIKMDSTLGPETEMSVRMCQEMPPNVPGSASIIR